MKYIITTIKKRSRYILIATILLSFFYIWWSFIYATVIGSGYGDWALFKQLIAGKITLPLWQVYYYPKNEAVQNAAEIALFLSVMPVFGVIVAWKYLTEKNSKNAHFQNIFELIKNNFFGQSGVIIGAYQNRLLRTKMPTHHIVIGPTRSGKGAGYVIPNAISYKGSLIVSDLKGEIFNATAGWRKKNGNEIFLFSPGELKTDSYNPLDSIRNSDIGNRITDIQNMAIILLPVTSQSENAVWQAQAQSLLAALISYVLESDKYEGKRNLTEVLEIVDRGVDLQKQAVDILRREEKKISKFTVSGLNAFITMTDKAALSILMDIRNALAAFRNPLISAATEKTTIPVNELNKRPISIYLAPDITNITLVKPILTIFIEHVLGLLTRKFDETALEVFFLLDEFRQLQRVNEVITKLPYVAGYNIKFSFIIQELRTLDTIYTPAGRDSLLGNCAIQIVMGANDESTARYVSAAVGKKQENSISKTHSGSGWQGGIKSQTTHVSTTDLIMPQEVRQLRNNREIILVEGNPPIMAEKIKYFQWPRFSKAVLFAKSNVPAIKSVDFRKYVNADTKKTVEENEEREDELLIEQHLVNEKEKAEQNLKTAKEEFKAIATKTIKKKPDFQANILDLLEKTVPDPLEE